MSWFKIFRAHCFREHRQSKKLEQLSQMICNWCKNRPLYDWFEGIVKECQSGGNDKLSLALTTWTLTAQISSRRKVNLLLLPVKDVCFSVLYILWVSASYRRSGVGRQEKGEEKAGRCSVFSLRFLSFSLLYPFLSSKKRLIHMLYSSILSVQYVAASSPGV